MTTGDAPPKHDTPAARLLADNLRRLISGHSEYNTPARLAAAMDEDPSQINRILRQATSPSVSTLEPIAQKLGVDVWVLLAPEAKAPAYEWPFKLVTRESYANLDDIEKGAAQDAMSNKIKELELLKQAHNTGEQSAQRQKRTGT